MQSWNGTAGTGPKFKRVEGARVKGAITEGVFFISLVIFRMGFTKAEKAELARLENRMHEITEAGSEFDNILEGKTEEQKMELQKLQAIMLLNKTGDPISKAGLLRHMGLRHIKKKADKASSDSQQPSNQADSTKPETSSKASQESKTIEPKGRRRQKEAQKNKKVMAKKSPKTVIKQ